MKFSKQERSQNYDSFMLMNDSNFSIFHQLPTKPSYANRRLIIVHHFVCKQPGFDVC